MVRGTETTWHGETDGCLVVWSCTKRWTFNWMDGWIDGLDCIRFKPKSKATIAKTCLRHTFEPTCKLHMYTYIHHTSNIEEETLLDFCRHTCALSCSCVRFYISFFSQFDWSFRFYFWLPWQRYKYLGLVLLLTHIKCKEI